MRSVLYLLGAFAFGLIFSPHVSTALERFSEKPVEVDYERWMASCIRDKFSCEGDIYRIDGNKPRLITRENAYDEAKTIEGTRRNLPFNHVSEIIPYDMNDPKWQKAFREIHGLPNKRLAEVPILRK